MTYSIVACDDHYLGVATASHWLAVGGMVPWADAGVGAVATQAFTEPAYGPRVLDRLRDGATAPEALADALAADAGRELRQVAVVDARGRVAHHTGGDCYPATAVSVLPEAVAIGNMLATDRVASGMTQAFAASPGDLADRLLSALAAGENGGGDARGRQAAAVRVVRRDGHHERGTGTVLDLRVDDHPQPIVELRRLLRLQEAYDAITSVAFPAGSGAGDDEAIAELARLAATTDGEARTEARLWLALRRQLSRNGDRGATDAGSAIAALAARWARHLRGRGRP